MLLGLCWSLRNSNQAFEYWFLLHFNPYRGRIHRNLYSVMLSKLLGMEYRKKERFASDLYNYLLSRQPLARRNTEVIFSEIYAGTLVAEESSTTVHLLISELNKCLWPVAKLSLTVRLQKQQDKCKQQIVFHIDAQEFGDITYAVVDY